MPEGAGPCALSKYYILSAKIVCAVAPDNSASHASARRMLRRPRAPSLTELDKSRRAEVERGDVVASARMPTRTAKYSSSARQRRAAPRAAARCKLSRATHRRALQAATRRAPPRAACRRAPRAAARCKPPRTASARRRAASSRAPCAAARCKPPRAAASCRRNAPRAMRHRGHAIAATAPPPRHRRHRHHPPSLSRHCPSPRCSHARRCRAHCYRAAAAAAPQPPPQPPRTAPPCRHQRRVRQRSGTAVPHCRGIRRATTTAWTPRRRGRGRAAAAVGPPPPRGAIRRARRRSLSWNVVVA